MNNRWRRQLNLELRYFQFRYPENSLFRYAGNPLEEDMFKYTFYSAKHCSKLLCFKYKHTPSFKKGAKHYAVKHR